MSTTNHQETEEMGIQLYPREPTVSPDLVFESTAETLRRNSSIKDGTTLDLDSVLDLGDDLDDLIDGIHHNTTITTLQLEGHLLCQLNPDECRSLLDALGGLPSLKKLHLHNYVAPLPLLTGLIEKARTLESITFHTVQLAGRNAAQGDAFAQAVGSLPCLENFKCSNAILAGGLSLEKLVRAVSEVWGLQKVEIELEAGGSLSCPALQALCQCPNLQELRLWRMTLHPEHLILIANNVQRSRTIHTLELGEMGYADHEAESYAAVAQMLQDSRLENFGMINFTGLDDEGAILIANALRGNTTLTDFNLRGYDNHVLGQEAAQAFADMFSHNRTLQRLGMNTVGLDEQGAVVIARALGQDNNTLESLMLQRIVGDREKGYLALCDMLETNTTLCRVYPEATGDVKVKMDFLLLLNSLGVRQVQLDVETTWNEFLYALDANGHNLSVLFYLLSNNPDFLR